MLWILCNVHPGEDGVVELSCPSRFSRVPIARAAIRHNQVLSPSLMGCGNLVCVGVGSSLDEFLRESVPHNYRMDEPPTALIQVLGATNE